MGFSEWSKDKFSCVVSLNNEIIGLQSTPAITLVVQDLLIRCTATPQIIASTSVQYQSGLKRINTFKKSLKYLLLPNKAQTLIMQTSYMQVTFKQKFHAVSELVQFKKQMLNLMVYCVTHFCIHFSILAIKKEPLDPALNSHP